MGLTRIHEDTRVVFRHSARLERAAVAFGALLLFTLAGPMALAALLLLRVQPISVPHGLTGLLTLGWLALLRPVGRAVLELVFPFEAVVDHGRGCVRLRQRLFRFDGSARGLRAVRLRRIRAEGLASLIFHVRSRLEILVDGGRWVQLDVSDEADDVVLGQLGASLCAVAGLPPLPGGPSEG